MGVYAAVRREPERGVGAMLRPCTASITGPRRGSDVLVTILDCPGAVVARAGDRERQQDEYYGFLLWCAATICKEPVHYSPVHSPTRYCILHCVQTYGRVLIVTLIKYKM